MLKFKRLENLKSLSKNSLFFLLVVLIVFISACSNKGEPTSSASGEVNYEELSGEIEVWGWNIAAAAMDDASKKFMEEYPDTKVTVRDMGQQDIEDRLTVGINAGGSGLPDVTMLQSEQIIGFVEANPDQFLNLSDWGFDQYEDDFSEFKKNIVKNSEGEYIAFPWDIGPVGIFYRVDYFEEAGINPEEINTWNDYIEAGEIIKDKLQVNMLPMEITYNDAIYRIMMNQLNASYYTEEGKINVDSKESTEVLNLMKEMYDKGIVSHVNDWDAQVGVVVNGEVASIPSGVWYMGTIKDQAPDLEGKWDVFELPAFEEGGNRAANYGGSDLVIPSSTENPELAYAFAEYFITKADVQLESFETYGLFPSLLPTHENPYFDEEVPYFNNSPVNRLFAGISDEVNPRVLTEDQARTSDIMIDTQTSILLDGKSVEEAIEDAVERIERETGRDMVE